MPLKLAILASCILLIPLFLLSAPASAATVTVPINVSVLETGAPAFTWSIGGSCSPSPSTGETGATVNVNMAAGCVFTLNTPVDGATQRDRFVSPANGAYTNTFTETSCSTSPCTTITISAHVEELLAVSANCYDPYVTPASQSGDSWYDYGTTLTVSCLGVWNRAGGTGVRATSWDWDGGTSASVATLSGFTSTSETMNSGHTFYVAAAAQYQLDLDVGATHALVSITTTPIKNDLYWYDAGTSVTYVGNGVFGREAGTGNRSTSWYLGSTTTELATNGTFTIKINMNTTYTLHVTVATQYELTLDSGALAAMASITPTPISGDNYWYDAGTQVTYTGNGVYGRSLGAGQRASSWQLDSNEVTPVLTTASFPVTITMTSAHSLHITTIAQFQVELTGSYAVSSLTAPTIPGDDYWYDSGTAVSLSLQGVFNRASGTGERMTSYQVNNGVTNMVASSNPVSILSSLTLTSPTSISAQAVTQYQVTLDKATLNALASVTPPSIVGDDYWYDLGTPVTLTLNGVWARNSTEGLRLTSYAVDGGQPVKAATTGTIVVDLGPATYPQSVSSTEIVQYFLSVSGGAGISYGPSPPITMDTGWYDSGTSVNVSSRGTFDVNGSTRQGIISWTIDGGSPTPVATTPVVMTSSIVMDSPHLVTFNSVTQYMIVIHVDDNSGSVPLSNSAITASVDGGAVSAPGGIVWVDSGSKLQVTDVNWKAVDVTPLNTTVYTVTSPFDIVLHARAYEAQVAVRDVFGFGIGGAPYTITFANQTTRHGTTPSDGVIPLGIIPLGTFEGTVSYFGVTSSFSGNASTNVSTTVIVPFSYAVVGVLVAVIAAAIYALIYLRRRPRAGNW